MTNHWKFPVAIQVASQTIGYDLLATRPLFDFRQMEIECEEWLEDED